MRFSFAISPTTKFIFCRFFSLAGPGFHLQTGKYPLNPSPFVFSCGIFETHHFLSSSSFFGSLCKCFESMLLGNRNSTFKAKFKFENCDSRHEKILPCFFRKLGFWSFLASLG
jgi:hypothetical protein